MDPNANLEEQRRIVASFEAGELADDDREDAAQRLVALVMALDEWLSRGGFLPTAWQR